MMCLLKVNNLSIGFHSSNNYKYKIIKNINFKLKKGEVLGIVGESGSGKSLTALSIMGLLPYPKAFHGKESSIKFNDIELLDNPKINEYRGNKISYIFQEPMSSLNPLHTIGKQIAETLIIHQKITEKQAYDETIKLLSLTGIKSAKEKYKSYPHELSGGQRQRVMLAMAIANKPDILIADEPTTALDVTIASQILDLLIELKEKIGMSIIFISHDLNIIRRISDRVLVMKSGRIVEEDTCDNIFKHPRHSYTKALIYSFNKLKENKNIKQPTVVEAKNITVKFPTKKSFLGKAKEYLYAVNNVSLKLKKGKTLGLVGESGSGKTTLAMSFAGLNSYEGNIFYQNDNIKHIKYKELRKKVQIVFQDPYNSLNPRMIIKDIIGEGLKVHFKLSKEQELDKIKKVLTEVGMKPDCLNKFPHEFSGGQRQRIAIARALVVEPEILILDEPTSALDVTIAAQIISLLQKIQDIRGLSYLFISHDIKAVRALADDIAVMKDGKIVELNYASKVLHNPINSYTKKLIQSANMGRKNETKLYKKYNKYNRKV
ncbi:MAG: ABC transporter ATP-binding protein [Alphaproteobacteria bacterium]|nr:ABC transporter ATP-binding protein [Alphaproteobacteria bacterium]